MENHCYDNVLGMQRGRGDGFTLDEAGKPTATNPWTTAATYSRPPAPTDSILRAFPMPNPCQEHRSRSTRGTRSGPPTPGAATTGSPRARAVRCRWGTSRPTSLPFVNSLAATFPVCDRYFCSVGAQTYPNRRFLMAGTSLGLSPSTFHRRRPPQRHHLPGPRAHGISWKNYYSSLPSVLIWSYQASLPGFSSHLAKTDQFFADAAAGTLPAVSLVDPDFDTSSEEDPQDVQYGDQFLSQVVNAVMDSPQWPHTLLVWTYDESGGLLRPRAPAVGARPRLVPPVLAPGTRRARSTATASGCRRASSRRTPARTTCPTWSMTTRPS